MRHALLLLLVALATAPAAAPPPSDAEAIEPAPQRVILRLSRHDEVAGVVELEDGEVVVIRRLDGTVSSHPKARILRIIRLVDPEPGQEGTVILRNGTRQSGIVIADGFERVVLEVDSIRIQFKRDTVEEVILQPTLEERYRQLKESLRPGMAADHMMLCRWLVDERRYDLAERELSQLLANHPEQVEARRLLEVVRAQIEMGSGPAPLPEPPAASPQGRPASRLLTQDEVNLIRVYEIDFDHPPRVAVAPDTIRKLLAGYGAHAALPAGASERNQLFQAPPIDLVKLMFLVRARELYGEIDVISEPRALSLFRQHVHDTWLMNNCATSRCHGGPDAGRLRLHAVNHRSERVRYTNLLILERLVVDPLWPLVNYESPPDSLILQYGLPPEVARRPHPQVPGWKPAFGSGSERVLDRAVEWIGAMMRPRPGYPIEFEPDAPPPAAPTAAPTAPTGPAAPAAPAGAPAGPPRGER
jgi:hypothetical protein